MFIYSCMFSHFVIGLNKLQKNSPFTIKLLIENNNKTAITGRLFYLLKKHGMLEK